MSFTRFPSSWIPGRRDFGKMALGGALGALLAPEESMAAVHPNAPGIKLCAQSGATPDDGQLLFLKQIGAEYVSVGAPPDMRTAEGFLAIKKRYADAGITVWNIGNTSVHNMPEVTLNLPGRDQKIEEYKQYIRNLGKAGIYYTTYAHMGNGIWSSGRAKVRGATAREFDMSSPDKRGVWDGENVGGAAVARARVHQGRDLGEFHLFHQTGGAGGGGEQRAHRHPPGRSAGAGAGGCAALHFRQLRGLSARIGDCRQSLTWGSACAAGRGWRAARR
jgi:hypothetical protein